MSVFHYLSSHNLRSKKALALAWDFAYEYEHSSHIVISYSSCTKRPCGFMLRGRLVFCPLLGKKGGEKNDE